MEDGSFHELSKMETFKGVCDANVHPMSIDWKLIWLIYSDRPIGRAPLPGEAKGLQHFAAQTSVHLVHDVMPRYQAAVDYVNITPTTFPFCHATTFTESSR